jgi:hypothetical protein
MEQYAAFDIEPEHNQRGTRRLQLGAGDVLWRTELRHVHRFGRQPRRLPHQLPTINSALTAAGNGAPAPQSRNATALVIEDGITWLKGAHSIAAGVSFTEYGYWAKNSNLVPRITTGLIASDPANAMFSAANFPGALPRTSAPRRRCMRS